jgi:hypothetical protein
MLAFLRTRLHIFEHRYRSTCLFRQEITCQKKKKKKKLNTTTMLSFQKGKEKDTINYSNKLLFSNRHGQECTIYRFPSQIERVIGPSLTKGN